MNGSEHVRALFQFLFKHIKVWGLRAFRVLGWMGFAVSVSTLCQEDFTKNPRDIA